MSSDPIAQIIRRVEEVERRMRRMFFAGSVTDIDSQKRLVRVTDGVDDEGKEMKTDWLPWRELSGTLKTKTLPSVGQQVTVQAPSGLLEDGWVSSGFFTQDNPPPTADDHDYVMTNGTVHISLKGDTFTVKSGNKSTFTVKGDHITSTVDDSTVDVKSGHINAQSPKVHTVGDTHLGVPAMDQEGTMHVAGDTGLATLQPKKQVKAMSDDSGGLDLALEEAGQAITAAAAAQSTANTALAEAEAGGGGGGA